MTIPLLEHPERSLYWTAAPEADTDFAPEDPLALDYLSQQVGLWLLPNLTTRTRRAQNWLIANFATCPTGAVRSGENEAGQ